jgi:hypothetical protein
MRRTLLPLPARNARLIQKHLQPFLGSPRETIDEYIAAAPLLA